jgi:uncharacterized membrane protein YhaH (DUF805 family)
MNWYLQALKQYATFGGRARRKEYWFFMLFNVLAIVVLSVLDVMVGTFSMEAEIGLFSGLYALAMLIPGLAVLVRRLHDTDRSGWWVLLNLIPVIGALVILVFTLLDSQPGANRFGPNPKGVTGAGTP